MNPNPLLRKLGCSDSDRLVIIHTDDIGMCQATIQAYKDLWEFGTISSGAVMVPCPWFPAVAQMCRENPGMDMGVHATLNAEWEGYRWGPVSTRDRESGLLDTRGLLSQGSRVRLPERQTRIRNCRGQCPGRSRRWRQALMSPTWIRIWARSSIPTSCNRICRQA